jgi:hypothetical protein
LRHFAIARNDDCSTWYLCQDLATISCEGENVSNGVRSARCLTEFFSAVVRAELSHLAV